MLLLNNLKHSDLHIFINSNIRRHIYINSYLPFINIDVIIIVEANTYVTRFLDVKYHIKTELKRVYVNIK